MRNKIRNYLDLIRFFSPTGTLLLFYPVVITFLWVDPGFSNLSLLGLFFLGTFLMRSSGCVINDLCDYRFDKHVFRTKNRPLASGAVSKFEAIILLFVLLICALSILLQLNYLSILFGLSLIIPISIYPLTKRFFKYPQLFLGATFNLGVFLMWFALEREISVIPFILYMSFVFWTIGYDTIYAHQDIADDMSLNLNSTAINFGNFNPIIIWLCYFVFIVLLLVAGILKGYGFVYFVLLNFVAIYVFGRLSFLDLEDRDDCLRFFKFNNVIGVAITLLHILSNIIN